MAVEDKIECPRCGRAMVPRLNFYDGTPVTFSRVQHVCPFCGTVLLESGGGVRWNTLIPLLIMFATLGLIFLYAVNHSGR